MSRRDPEDTGNTLVELLIVIVVLGILAAIAIPVYLSQKGRSIEAGMRSDLRATATLMETHFVDTSVYPSDLDVLLAEQDIDLHLSGNTVVTVELAEGEHYCLKAQNPAVTTALRYDNVAGGLLGVNEPCA
jgi:type IV pilus assembly protein PilA